MTKTMAEVIEKHLLVDTDACDCYEMFYDTRLTSSQIAHEHSLHVEMELHNAGFGLVADAGAKALEDAAAKVMGPSDVLLDGATCRWIAMELRERAAAVRGEDAHG